MSEHRRAAIYGRVSATGGRQDVANQLAQLREFAATQDWQVQQEYVDEGSGNTPDREQFRQMFEDAARRRFDVLLFWSLDRLSREGALETLNHLNRLASYGVGFRSFTEPYLDSCGIFRDTVVAILGTIAKQERLRTSERVRAGLERARKAGVKVGRPRRVFDRQKILDLQAEGISLREIARRLGVGDGTVRRALKELNSASQVRQKPSKGSV